MRVNLGRVVSIMAVHILVLGNNSKLSPTRLPSKYQSIYLMQIRILESYFKKRTQKYLCVEFVFYAFLQFYVYKQI